MREAGFGTYSLSGMEVYSGSCGGFQLQGITVDSISAETVCSVSAEQVCYLVWQPLQFVGPFFISLWQSLHAFLCAKSLPKPAIFPPSTFSWHFLQSFRASACALCLKVTPFFISITSAANADPAKTVTVSNATIIFFMLMSPFCGFLRNAQ